MYDIFKPVVTKRASETVFESLKERIESESFKPGEKLPSERALMTEYNRSHPTIREALRLLEGAGYVEVIHGSGIIVRNRKEDMVTEPLEDLLRFRHINPEEMEDFFAATEPAYAAKAAEEHIAEDELELKRCYDRLRKSQASPANYFLRMKQFHIQMVRSIRNPLITLVWESIYNMTMLPADTYLYTELPQITQMHKKVLDSYIARDTENIRVHMTDCWKLMHVMTSSIRLSNDRTHSGVRSHKASEIIYDNLRNHILEGTFQPGDKLPPERKLMEYYDKSRPVIREALKMLETKNFVTTNRGSGTVVNMMTAKDVEEALIYMIRNRSISLKDLMEVRVIVEPVTAKWAAERRSESELERMASLLERADRENTDRAHLIELGNAFNGVVAKACRNEIMDTLCQIISQFMQDQYLKVPGSYQLKDYPLISQQHHAVLEAIRAEKGETAAKAALEHITDLHDRLFVYDENLVV